MAGFLCIGWQHKSALGGSLTLYRVAELIVFSKRPAHQHLDDELSRHGIPLTLSQIKPENLEELIDHLEDLTVDVDGKEGNTTKVRVFCE